MRTLVGTITAASIVIGFYIGLYLWVWRTFKTRPNVSITRFIAYKTATEQHTGRSHDRHGQAAPGGTRTTGAQNSGNHKTSKSTCKYKEGI